MFLPPRGENSLYLPPLVLGGGLFFCLSPTKRRKTEKRPKLLCGMGSTHFHVLPRQGREQCYPPPHLGGEHKNVPKTQKYPQTPLNASDSLFVSQKSPTRKAEASLRLASAFHVGDFCSTQRVCTPLFQKPRLRRGFWKSGGRLSSSPEITTCQSDDFHSSPGPRRKTEKPPKGTCPVGSKPFQCSPPKTCEHTFTCGPSAHTWIYIPNSSRVKPRSPISRLRREIGCFEGMRLLPEVGSFVIPHHVLPLGDRDSLHRFSPGGRTAVFISPQGGHTSRSSFPPGGTVQSGLHSPRGERTTQKHPSPGENAGFSLLSPGGGDV